jgi:hypothetical protein
MFTLAFTVMNFVVWTLLGVVLVWLAVRSRRAKKSQDALVRSLQGGDHLNWFRIKLSTPHFFKRRMKLLGFESSAVLVNHPDRVRVLAELPSGERIDRSWPKNGIPLAWIGNQNLGSSNMHWLTLGTGPEQLMISADTGFNAVQSREATADICRMISPAFELPGLATSDFALEKNKASLAAVVAFFVLLAYALLDGMIINSTELVGYGKAPALTPLVAVLAIPVYLLLIRGRVPSRESLTLAILMALGFVLATMPALKRADQVLAGGARTYQYTLVSAGKLEPVEKGPPSLNFRKAREYWQQFETGSIHEFRLIHGPLGLWQLERAEINARYRAFYRKLDGTD